MSIYSNTETSLAMSILAVYGAALSGLAMSVPTVRSRVFSRPVNNTPMRQQTGSQRRLFWQKIIISDNAVMFTLSRLISNQCMAVESRYYIIQYLTVGTFLFV